MRTRSLILAGVVTTSVAFAADPTPEQSQFFESKIRPILSEKCYKCHSAEQGKTKGGLALDTKEATLKGGDTGPAVKPGDPSKSLLVQAVLYTDEDLQMPPKGEKLSDQQIADLTAWVKMGAPDPRKDSKGGKLTGLTDKARSHYAFQSPKKTAIPEVKNRSWCVTQVDAFILKKLEEKGMSPSPVAAKEALLRRASYDLLGLPPSPQEIDAFVQDESPYAFAKVVDRMLASPQYGERWGRFWLDSARYADTTGGDRNARREDYRYPYAWTYRDWVIKAFNDDMPYDQFVLQQLAADKLPKNKPENLAALGFLTVGERFNNNNDVINDRIDVVSKGFLGLTVACARCHDHMFDPISIKDYYSFHGIFSSIVEPTEKPLINASTNKALFEDFQKKVEAVEQENRDKYYKTVSDSTWMFRQKAAAYIIAGHKRRNGASEEEQQAGDKMVRDEKLDPEIVREVRRDFRKENPIMGPLARLMEGGDSFKTIVAEIAANNDKRYKYNPIVAAAFKGANPQTFEEVAEIYSKVFASVEPKAKDVVKAFSDAKTGAVTGADPADVQLVAFPFSLEPASELNTDGLRKVTNGWPLQMQNRARIAFAKVNELLLTHDGAPVRAMVVADAPKPHDSPVFLRGQAETRGEMVPRRFLEVLSDGKPQPFRQGSGRLELAQSIANPKNPLTARVIVNRVWMHHFGQGFVRTPDDLGTQSEAPSHPELLDYLAVWFMEQGWSLKKLHKLIMLSKVYQLSSYTIPAYETMDPENRLLWRANVRRLDFEAIRDSLLVFSGRLDRTLGGQPVNLTDEPYSYRRSVYGYIDRGNLPELMSHFDFANPDMPNSARTTTIVPQQALFLMNSPMAVDVARRVIARPEFQTAGLDIRRVLAIYKIIFQRPPTKSEVELAMQFITAENRKNGEVLAAMKETTEKAQKQIEKQYSDMMGRNDGTKAIQNEGQLVERKPLNPWETYAHALLFSNEMTYIN
ncbi:PSD1 and planctomycete cytochrome C domain-containing protein [Verrucomicrobiota bacterium sgz303538]